MNRIFLFLIPVLLCGTSLAQSTNEAVRGEIDRALRTHVNKLFPDYSCNLNNCGHTYSGGFKITKSQTIQGSLRTWGVAKVSYKNARTGGNAKIYFYAELRKRDGEVYVSKLRWKSGDCMKYKTIFDSNNP